MGWEFIKEREREWENEVWKLRRGYMTGKGGNDSESKIVNLVEEEREEERQEEEECKYELTFILLRLIVYTQVVNSGTLYPS